MAEQSGIFEHATKAVKDPNTRLGEAEPGSPFVVVALSYLGVLAVSCGVAALVYWVSLA